MSEQTSGPPTEDPNDILERAGNVEFELVAYTVGDVGEWKLEPAPSDRDWMAANNRHAYKCLPLTISNAAGWVIRSPVTFTATWSGSEAKGSTGIIFEDAYNHYAGAITDHFGAGIVTFNIPWLFRANRPGVALRVSGPPNMPKQNAQPLEGIVEIDWLPFTFTCNTKIIKPGIPVAFAKGEPIAFVSPVSLDLVEAARPRIRPLAADPELAAAYNEWNRLRRQFNADPTRGAGDWQKFYHGATDRYSPPPTHRTSVSIPEFGRES